MYNIISLTIFLLGASTSCAKHPAKAAADFYETDTIVMATSQKVFLLGIGQKMLEIPLKSIKHDPLDNSKTIRVLFENVRVDASGEGAYEVYLNHEKLVNGARNDANLPQENLIGSLNLYNLTIPNSPPVIALKLPDNLRKQVVSNEQTWSQLSIIVVFRGNIMPDQAEVEHTGQLYFGKVSIVQ